MTFSHVSINNPDPLSGVHNRIMARDLLHLQTCLIYTQAPGVGGGGGSEIQLLQGLVRLQSAVLLALRAVISWECFSLQVTHR